MANAYVTNADLILEYSNLTTDGFLGNDGIRHLCERASRVFDTFTRRHCWAKTATNYYRGAGARLWLPDGDILSVTTLKTDDDADGTFETTWATTDFDLISSEEGFNGAPYDGLEITDFGVNGSFAAGVRRGVEIAGVFGIGNGVDADPVVRSVTTANEAIDATEVSIIMSAGTDMEVGRTIRIDSEQMYITAVSSSTITVIRGVNGTTAATHDTGTVVDYYTYPDEVVQAVIMQFGRWHSQKSDGYIADAIGSGGFEQTSSRELVADMRDVIERYRRLRVG